MNPQVRHWSKSRENFFSALKTVQNNLFRINWGKIMQTWAAADKFYWVTILVSI